MVKFHVRYWFESNGSDRTGEQVIEAIEAVSAAEVAQMVQERLQRDPIFTVTPAFGPAAKRGDSNGGLVLIQSAHVRYVEILPAPSVAG